MDIDYKRLGQRIKTGRADLRLSQEKLAEACEISSTYISHIETGHAHPSLDVLFKIAAVLQVTPDALLMDSIFHSTEHITAEISRKLNRCTSESIHTINRLIDVILERQKI